MIEIVVIGVLCGAISALVFRTSAEISALVPIFRHMHALLLEFRLFFAEPAFIWKAQKALVRANFQLCASLLKPALILALPMTWLMLQLGNEPLHVGEPAVVSARSSTELTIEAPPGIAVETEPVHSQGLMFWRIRPLRAVSGDLRFRANGITLTKSVVAGDGSISLPLRRERFFFGSHAGVEWLDVDYPEASHWWMVWFLGACTAGAIPFLAWGHRR